MLSLFGLPSEGIILEMPSLSTDGSKVTLKVGSMGQLDVTLESPPRPHLESGFKTHLEVDLTMTSSDSPEDTALSVSEHHKTSEVYVVDATSSSPKHQKAPEVESGVFKLPEAPNQVIMMTSTKTTTVQHQTTSEASSLTITPQQQHQTLDPRQKEAAERERVAMQLQKSLEAPVDSASPDLFPEAPTKLPGVDNTLHAVFERLTQQEETSVSKFDIILSCSIQ